MPNYVEIAISGPLRKTFIYEHPDTIGPLTPGQRVVVPFGNYRKTGFYLRPASKPTAFKTKPIVRTLDNSSFFNDDLFKLCTWMADYYFANPADCLIAALPSILKKNKTADYYWKEFLPERYEKDLSTTFKPNKKISQATINKINSIKSGLLKILIKDSVVVEQWKSTSADPSGKLKGYKPIDQEIWERYFNPTKFNPPRYDGIKSKSDLLTEGWSAYQIKKALTNHVLIPVYHDIGHPLEFIAPRADLDLIQLNSQQQSVIDDISKRLDENFYVSLLHGVTGSGKTIVYCYLCREILKQNKTVLVMTPEIALTSTTLAYFRGFFGDQVTVIHSAMTEKERLESWHGIKNGRYRIVVGPRSAIFAPLNDLGMIIVDEEHDGSYKQDDPAPRFHGRDCAIMRAKINNIPVILGSASPSLESYYKAKSGRYNLLELTERPGKAVLPDVRTIDMRKERLEGDLFYFSYPLKKEVEKTINQDKQVILFLNRRGFSPQLKCPDCGHVPQCPNCRLNLTFHKAGKKLTCHYCGHLDYKYDSCEKCYGSDFFFIGTGTQKVEQNIPRLFEHAQTIRLDSDSAEGRTKAYDILKSFADKKHNLLLGTQMVTKGLDMPDVTLVGVLSADAALDLPDFRASEKAFSRLLQVAGRSGRSDIKGQVLIQTYCPEHPIISFAANQDYAGFYEKEIDNRKELAYPPFSRIINFIFSSKDELSLEKLALDFRSRLMNKIKEAQIKLHLLGPAPCPMYFLRNKYRRHLFVKTNQVVKLTKMLTAWDEAEPNFKLPASIRLNIDVDPDDML